VSRERGAEIRIGLAGAGLMGQAHAQALSFIEGATLCAVVDPDRAAAGRLAALHGAESYSNLDDLFTESGLDALIVASSEGTHRELCLAALSRGIHVLVEKPMEETLHACEELIQAAERSGAFLMPGHLLRFDPRYLSAHAAIARGEIGEVRSISTCRHNRRSNGRRLYKRTNVLRFLGTHEVDWVLWCLGGMPELVFAQRTSIAALRERAEGWHLLLSFPGGVVATIVVSWLIPDRGVTPLIADADVFGTKGSIRVQGGFESLEVTSADGPAEQDTIYGSGAFPGAVGEELRYFLGCVHSGKAPSRVSGEDALNTLKVILAAEESAYTGQLVNPEKVQSGNQPSGQAAKNKERRRR